VARPEHHPWNPLIATHPIRISDDLLSMFHGAIQDKVKHYEKRWNEVRDLPPAVIEPRPEKPIDPSLPEPVKEVLEKHNEWIRERNTFPDIGIDENARLQEAIRQLLEESQWALAAIERMRGYRKSPSQPSLQFDGWEQIVPKRRRF